MNAVVHHPSYVAPAPARSTYQWNKNGLIRDLLRDHGDAIRWHVPAAMPRKWIEAVHDPEYVAQVLAAGVSPERVRRIGFPVTPAVAERSRYVAGGTYRALRLAQRVGFAANTAGGSHHALYDTGAGFCVLNDLAIAANRLVAEGHARRLLIVDCDVHQGDGTASLLAGRSDIATYSLHAEKNFPVRKARSTLDVGLPDGTGDADYLRVLADTLLPLIDDFAPDIILYQAGVDPFEGDRLGRLKLTQAGLNARDGWIARVCATRGLPLASAVGGGYGAEAMEVAHRHVAAIVALGDSYAKHRLQGGSAILSLDADAARVEGGSEETK